MVSYCCKRTVNKELILVDYRVRNPVCELGWTQKKTQTQSELVSANWSPNGWLISTGSADPDINIFDIRVNREDMIKDEVHLIAKNYLK